MTKGIIDGVECIIYEQNLFNDNQPYIKYGSQQITSKQIKIHIDYIIDFIGNLIERGTETDERLKKYSTALTVYETMKAILNRRPWRHPRVEEIKSTIDVVEEISLKETKDPVQKDLVKSTAFFAKFMFDIGG